MREINNSVELNKALSNSDKLFVLDFYAAWCGPCRNLMPKLNTFENKHTHATFIKINVDDAEDLASTYNVQALPTLVFIKNGKEMHRIMGADSESIENYIEHNS